MNNASWDPGLYLRFDQYRTRAAHDLLARVELYDPRSAVDLGCGPGNSTALLSARWPGAAITGIDNSAEMLARARTAYPQTAWVEADLSAWRPAEPADLIFSNAAFQWVPDHGALLPALCSCLRPGGVLAFQIPAIHDQPAAAVYRSLLNSAEWSLYEPPAEGLTVETPAFYHNVLGGSCDRVEIWETVYHHLLAGHKEIVTWYQSTGLRPVLAAMPDDSTRKAFADELVRHYREHFPRLNDGRVLFPFRRLFVVAVR